MILWEERKAVKTENGQKIKNTRLLNTLLTAKPIEKEQFKDSEQYYCIKTAYSQEIYVYYVENEIYIKYTDYHAGVSDVDENGNEVPIVKQWYYVIDKI